MRCARPWLTALGLTLLVGGLLAAPCSSLAACCALKAEPASHAMHSVALGGATTSAASHCHSSEDSACRSGLSGLDRQCGNFGQTVLPVSSKHPLEQSQAEQGSARLPAAQGVSAEPGFGTDSPSFTHRHRHRTGTLYELHCVLLL